MDVYLIVGVVLALLILGLLASTLVLRHRINVLAGRVEEVMCVADAMSCHTVELSGIIEGMAHDKDEWLNGARHQAFGDNETLRRRRELGMGVLRGTVKNDD